MNTRLIKDIFSLGAYKAKDLAIRNLIKKEVAKLKDVELSQDKFGNLYANKGSASLKPCYACHVDTVHMHKRADVHIINGNLVTFNKDFQQIGCGGDDKCGIYCCIELLKTLKDAKCCFFRQEEIGCIGASKADLSFFTDCAFVCEIDRKGKTDIVTSVYRNISSSEFLADLQPIAKKHKRKFTSGGITDVVELQAIGLDLSCINISAGYYRPHTRTEYVNLTDLHNTLLLAAELSRLAGKRYVMPANSFFDYGDDYQDEYLEAEYEIYKEYFPSFEDYKYFVSNGFKF